MTFLNTGAGAHPSKELFIIFIDGKEYKYHEPKITSQEILQLANKNPPTCFSVYRGLEGCDFELVRPGEVVDLRELGKERFSIKDPVVFDYTVNNEPESTDRQAMTPAQILKRAAIDPTKEYLVQLIKGKPEEIYAWNLDEQITMVCSGMTFVTRPWVEEADIEALGKKCQPVPVAKRYKIKVQNQLKVVPNPFLTEEEIIRLGGKSDVECWDVLQFFSNQAEPVKLAKGATVDLRTQCLLYFILQPKKQTEGKSTRQAFQLPADDGQFLNAQGLPWETLHSPHGHCVLIHDFPVPAGYNVSTAKLILRIPPTYPAAQIDMAYFSPALSLTSGKQIRALTPLTLDGEVYQQWSRHRQPGQWIPGVDNIATHLFLVKNWLINELNN